MMQDIINWFRDAFNTGIEWFKALFNDLVELLQDLAILILDGVLTALASLITSIPVPNFIQAGLGSLFTGLDPAVLYFMSQSGFAQAVALLGAGFAFRMLRKVFTLFQW